MKYKYTFGVSRNKIPFETAEQLDEICDRFGASFYQCDYVKDATGEGYKHWFWFFDRGYPDNTEHMNKIYQAIAEAGIILP